MTKWIVAAVVLIILVGGGLYFFTDIFKSAPEPGPTTQIPTTATYASSSMAISFTYPSNYMLVEPYEYPFGDTGKVISGVALMVPVAMATGTNLSADTRISVEQLPNARNCSADIFILENVVATEATDGGVTYSVATSSSAGAGNLYEETVYALPDSTPCTAVRYVVHSTQLANYLAGEVQAFDRAALIASFDSIRRSLKVGANATTTL